MRYRGFKSHPHRRYHMMERSRSGFLFVPSVITNEDPFQVGLSYKLYRHSKEGCRGNRIEQLGTFSLESMISRMESYERMGMVTDLSTRMLYLFSQAERDRLTAFKEKLKLSEKAEGYWRKAINELNY